MKGLNITTYSYTNSGSRSNNEDYCKAYQHDSYGAWVLADGLGGHGSGEVASRLAADYVIEVAKRTKLFSDEDLLAIMNASNKQILSSQKKNLTDKDMRTTIVSAFMKDEKIKYFNVGDSRFYYFKNGCLYKQSMDHSISQAAVGMGEITQDEIRFHDDRNKLLKVLGDTEDLKISKVEPAINIESGDSFLLCSDGLWEYVYETEMEIDLLKSSTPEEWCNFMVKRLLHRVTGNNDNFTAVCVFIGS